MQSIVGALLILIFKIGKTSFLPRLSALSVAFGHSVDSYLLNTPKSLKIDHNPYANRVKSLTFDYFSRPIYIELMDWQFVQGDCLVEFIFSNIGL